MYLDARRSKVVNNSAMTADAEISARADMSACAETSGGG
jgi:hypothetical protein